MVYIYKYVIHETDPLDITPIQTITLPQEILSISSCDQKHAQDRGDVPIIFRCSNHLHLFVFDTKEMLMKEKSKIKVEGFLGMGWISER